MLPKVMLPEHVLELRQSGRKLLVPFITGGVEHWEQTILAVDEAGADIIEVGIPFSDAVMDGPVICEANDQALANGATPKSILKAVSKLQTSAPLVVMTYYNIAFRAGLAEFAEMLSSNGVRGAILADLPYEHAKDWTQMAEKSEVAAILLAAPTASDERLKNIAQLSAGFVYAVGLLGVTGTRQDLAQSTIEIVKRLKHITDKPVLAGVGISTPEQAAVVCEYADGVIVGSALVKKLLTERSAQAVGDLVADFRDALS